jgi:hypothetical protein
MHASLCPEKSRISCCVVCVVVVVITSWEYIDVQLIGCGSS